MATGPRYADHVALEPAAMPAHTTRVTVFRTSDSLQYSARSATVRIDGTTRGGCDYAGYQTFRVTPGPHVIVVEMSGADGACAVSVDVLGGEDYFYELRPRFEHGVAGWASWFGAMGPVAAVIGSLAVIGTDPRAGGCAGPFSITAVEEGIAHARVKDLRRSN